MSEERIQLLRDMSNEAVDHRMLTKLMEIMFVPPNENYIPIADWERETKRFVHVLPDSIEQRILAEVRTE